MSLCTGLDCAGVLGQGSTKFGLCTLFTGINILTFLESRDNLEEEEERLETERFKEDDLDLCCSSS